MSVREKLQPPPASPAGMSTAAKSSARPAKRMKLNISPSNSIATKHTIPAAAYKTWTTVPKRIAQVQIPKHKKPSFQTLPRELQDKVRSYLPVHMNVTLFARSKQLAKLLSETVVIVNNKEDWREFLVLERVSKGFRSLLVSAFRREAQGSRIKVSMNMLEAPIMQINDTGRYWPSLFGGDDSKAAIAPRKWLTVFESVQLTIAYGAAHNSHSTAWDSRGTSRPSKHTVKLLTATVTMRPAPRKLAKPTKIDLSWSDASEPTFRFGMDLVLAQAIDELTYKLRASFDAPNVIREICSPTFLASLFYHTVNPLLVSRIPGIYFGGFPDARYECSTWGRLPSTKSEDTCVKLGWQGRSTQGRVNERVDEVEMSDGGL